MIPRNHMSIIQACLSQI